MLNKFINKITFNYTFKRYQTLAVFFIFCLCTLPDAHASEPVPSGKGQFSVEINGGIMLGGEINRDNFSFKNGPAFFLSPAYHISNRWATGLLFGFISTTDEIILPFGAGMTFYLRETMPSFYISLYGGYAEAWTKGDLSDDYVLRGNWFIQPAFGYQLPLTEKIHGLFGLAFHHQRASLQYRDPAVDKLSVPIDWDYLHIRIGLAF